MFRREIKPLGEILQRLLREEGLETPLLQKRLVEAWPEVAGRMVADYTGETSIRNQTFFVKITNAALRNDLTLMRTQLVKRLNERVGAFVITDIRIY